MEELITGKIIITIRNEQDVDYFFNSDEYLSLNTHYGTGHPFASMEDHKKSMKDLLWDYEQYAFDLKTGTIHGSIIDGNLCVII